MQCASSHWVKFATRSVRNARSSPMPMIDWSSASARPAVVPLPASSRGGRIASPRCNRRLTSRTVACEVPTLRATSRRLALGAASRCRNTWRRTAAASTGRHRPSRPTRRPDGSSSGARRPRSFATVATDTPQTSAIRRSDQSTWLARMRRTAACRSAVESGFPWLMFACTAATYASASVPLTISAITVVRPTRRVAKTLCTPSMISRDGRCTRIGGSWSMRSASIRMCSASR